MNIFHRHFRSFRVHFDGAQRPPQGPEHTISPTTSAFVILLSFFFALFSLTGCRNATKVIDFELPAYTNQLVVECYLEPGLPPVAFISESLPLLDETDYSLLSDMEVVVTWDGGRDSLIFDTTYRVYIGRTLIPTTPDYSLTYSLFVKDDQGRQAHSTTRFLPPVPIDTASFEIDIKRKSTVSVSWTDIPGEENFYRLTMAGSKSENRYNTRLNDDFLDGEQINLTTDNRFRKGDTMSVRLYHILPEYYDFLYTLRRADIDGSVISEPVNLISNIEGGLGIFTAFSYVDTTFKIKNP